MTESAQPRVAALIVAHNAQKFIVDTVQSCLQQTYQNLKVFVLDNASTDQTRTRLAEIRDPRLRVIASMANLGPYAGLNLLLDDPEVRLYDLIAIQDHDDLWLPEKIMRQVAYLDANPEVIDCGCGSFYYYEGKNVVVETDNFALNGYADHTTIVFRNQDFRYNPSAALPDEHFQAVVLRRRGALSSLPETLAVHRIRADQHNLSRSRSQWNLAGAWAHLRYTGYRGKAGSLAMVISALIPEPLAWWSRRHATYKKTSWYSVPEFERRYHLILRRTTTT